MKKSKVRFGIAQMDPTVGDYRGNANKVIRWIQAANRKKTDILVFPELALSGYPVWDLANKKRFVEEGWRQLERIQKATRGMKVAVFLGFIDRPRKRGGRSYNAMAWIEKGKVRGIQHKRLLPTYDVFLEDIFFKPGKESQVFPTHQLKLGPTICEDIWDDRYSVKPLRDLRRKRAECVLNISSSPYYKDVAQKRDVLLKKHAIRYRLPILYVNQVGAQDDLIFDGRSLFVDPKGHVLFRAPAFEEGLFYYDWLPGARQKASLPLRPIHTEPAEVYQALVLGIRDYCRKNRFGKVVLGLSGGIDSALTAALAVDALGPKAVRGITMPGKYSSRGSWKDSLELSKRLGIQCDVHPIGEKYQQWLRLYQKQKGKRKKRRSSKVTLAMENLQARLRGLELMYVSNDESRLLLTTGNKSELAVGYCTLYGDMAGGLAVLGDVYKNDVYKLAWYRNQIEEVIPRAILEKEPSAELRPDQKDQDSLPPYEVLDEILYLYIECNKGRDEIFEELRPRKVSLRVISDIIRKVDHNEYKRRQTPPILRVSEKAWFGRRMPITNRFEN